MKYCDKCGAQLPDGAGFCTSCGSPLAANPANNKKAQTNPANMYDQTAGVYSTNPAAAVVGSGKKVLIIAAAAVAVLVIAGFSVFFGLKNRAGTKFTNALEKTVEAKSITCEISAKMSDDDDDDDSYSVTFQGYKDGENNQFSFKEEENKDYTTTGAFIDGKMITVRNRNGKYSVYQDDPDDDEEELYELIAERDIDKICEYVDDHADDIELLDEDCKDAYKKALKFLEKNFNNPDDSDFIDNFEKDGKTCSCEIDVVKLAKAVLDDSEIEFTKDAKKGIESLVDNMGGFSISPELEYTIEKGYITNFKVSIKVKNQELSLEGDLNHDKLDPDETDAAKALDDYEEHKDDNSGDIYTKDDKSSDIYTEEEDSDDEDYDEEEY